MPNFQKSTLQIQYPLSPRKFWKKMLGQILPVFLVSIVGMLLIILIRMAAGANIPAGVPTPQSMILYLIFFGFAMFLPIFIIYAIYIKAYIKRYYYDAGADFVTIKKRVFTPTEIHVQYGKIQDVYVDQDLMDRMLGTYDVHIASATVSSGIEAHIDGVDKTAAEGLKSFLLAKISGQATSTNQPNPNIEQKANISFQSNEEISSTTYPISSSWIPATLFLGLITNFIYAALFTAGIISTGLKKGRSVSWGLTLVIFIVLYVFFFLWFLIYLVVWKKNFKFAFLSNFIQINEAVISKSEKQLPYSSIQDVTVGQGWFDRLFGICNVKITNATTGRDNIVELPGQTLENGNKIAAILKNLILSADRSKTGL